MRKNKKNPRKMYIKFLKLKNYLHCFALVYCIQLVLAKIQDILMNVSIMLLKAFFSDPASLLRYLVIKRALIAS